LKLHKYRRVFKKMVTLNLESVIHLTPEQFKLLCYDNPETKLELTATGKLVVMSPTGGESGIRNTEIAYQLQAWSRSNQLGVVFDSSTMFQLPNKTFRSPDAAWIALSRWNALSQDEKKTFPPIAPDFVIELRSESGRLTKLQDKMQEYIDNGVRLGWLIDPLQKQVEIYRIGQPKEVLLSPATIDGENVLPGFVLDLPRIFA
jgi:Uma2 family endonuclease